MTAKLDSLVKMSNALGEPDQEYVILGEGNTSAREDDATLWVKASGTPLNNIGRDGFVHVYLEPLLALVEAAEVDDDRVQTVLSGAVVSQQASKRPSVETTFHAVALTDGEAAFVGHTHPTAVNSILCSVQAREAFAGRLFPDEIVVCGPAPAFVPYTDPGMPLALAIRAEIRRYRDAYDRPPKVILLQNHGLIALGSSASEVLQITAMLVKTATIILGAHVMGGTRFLSQDDVRRIDSRPDELYRRRKLAGTGDGDGAEQQDV